MAKLVAVCRSDDYRFERRQLALEVDDNLKMVVQFADGCVGCDPVSIKQKELERFVTRYLALSNDEIAVGLIVTNKEVFSLLSQLVPCVGCRRSVERLYRQLVDSGHPALEPLVVTPNGELSIKHDYLFDAKAVYALFYIHGSNLSTIMDGIPKSKKNKRCMLHSLDTHKTKSLGWMDIWDLLSKECREETVLIECDNFMDTLENYLRKHRFCSECKAKVLRAYSILVHDLDPNTERGYCPALYQKLSCCPGERHIHVSCETDFIAHLIGRAEPELTGSRRERHAKTLDIAQEEVLTCLGIHLYERLHRIWQKLRAEEQTWQILFYLGVDALRKNFEVALERKQGISNLELMCQELLQEEKAKEQKRELRRQKRKKKKTKQKQGDDASDMAEQEKENCKCDENTNICSAVCASCDENHLSNTTNRRSWECDQKQAEPPGKDGVVGGEGHSNRSDCGYSSGHEGCDSCSMPSSNDGSEVACSEGICNHDGDSPLCHRPELSETCCHDCLGAGDGKCDSSITKGLSSNGRGCSSNELDKNRVLNGHDNAEQLSHSDRGSQVRTGQCHGAEKSKACTGKGKCRGAMTTIEKAEFGLELTLEDMLEESCSSDEEEFISEEEIKQFKANHGTLVSQRLELRETLKQRFAIMRQRGCPCPLIKCSFPQGSGCMHQIAEELGKASLD